MTRFPRQLAVAVVVLFAFTFLSGCGSNNEDKKEETNNDAPPVVTPDDNGDTQPQPDKKTCTVTKNIETQIVSDDGSGGKLTGEKCKKKNATLKVGNKCEFECKDPKDYNKTGHIKCGKDGKIENTAKCNRTDEKKKADEEADERLKAQAKKKSIVKLLIKLNKARKEGDVKKFIDIEAKEWENIKGKYNELNADGGKLKELEQKFDAWEIARKKDTAKRYITGYLEKKLPKETKKNITQWVYGTLVTLTTMKRRLENKDDQEDAVRECKEGIEKLKGINVLLPAMIEEIGYGKDKQAQKIGAYLRGGLLDLSAEAKKYNDASDGAEKKNVRQQLASGYCVGEIKRIMADAIGTHPVPFNAHHLDDFNTYVDHEKGRSAANVLRLHRYVMHDELHEVASKFGRYLLRRRITNEFNNRDPQVVGRIETYVDSAWTGLSNGILQARTARDCTNVLEGEPLNFARQFVKNEFRTVFPVPRQPHLQGVDNYVMHLDERTANRIVSEGDDAALQVQVERAAAAFAEIRLLDLVNEDHDLAAADGAPGDGQIIQTKTRRQSRNYVSGLSAADRIALVQLTKEDILRDVEANAPEDD